MMVKAVTLLLAGIAFVCTAGAASTQPAPLSPDSPVDAVLDALDAVGRDLKSFSAAVRLAETDQIAGDTVTRIGQTLYQSAGPEGPRIRVTFEKRIQEGAVAEQKFEYLLAGRWLVDRNYARKIEVNRQVLAPGEKINLLKLGEGPFPLPIGQKKEDVHQQFQVAKVELAPADDPKNTLQLRLIPKPDTRLARSFSQIDVWVDLTNHFPRRIRTADKHGGTTIRTTDLDDVKIGIELSDSDFKLPEINQAEWTRRDEPFEE